jgi:hypothetical protein
VSAVFIFRFLEEGEALLVIYHLVRESMGRLRPEWCCVPCLLRIAGSFHFNLAYTFLHPISTLIYFSHLITLTLPSSHGKDNKLIVWELSEEDEASMSVVLPVDTPPQARKEPWVLHILHVNTMNFCSFAQTDVEASSESEDELLIAVPNTMSSETVSSAFH